MAKGEIFKGLPKWSQGLIAVAVVGGVAFVGYKIYKQFQSAKDSKDSNKVTNDANQELNNLVKGGQKLSFPLANYSSAANTIQKLLDGCDSFGSEVAVVYEVIKVVKKPIDWYQLIKAFGTREVADCGWGKTKYDLTSLLKDQLDTAGAYTISKPDFKKSGWAVNSIDILEDYLKTKGITI
jgi:hypothetical protein